MNTMCSSPRGFFRFQTVAILLCAFMSTALLASEAGRVQVASANIGFGFKLLKEIVKEQPGRNVFICPYGASTVLQMACNGAGGETKSEMQGVLGTAGLTSDIVNAANKDFYQALNGRDTNVILNIANALWYQK